MTHRTPASTVYLLRHAHSVANGRGILAGQSKGIKLSAIGKKQADNLVATLVPLDIDYVYLSPLERCLETVTPFLKVHEKALISQSPEFVEMNYGGWTGKRLAILSRRSMWKDIQKEPSTVRFPQGESFLEMRHRAVAGIESLRGKPGNHLVVSHGDVIRVILNHYLGAHLDNFQRLSIDPASISAIRFAHGGVTIQNMNSTSSVSAHSSSTLGGGAGKK